MQIFTKLANRWAERECDDASATSSARRSRARACEVTIAHDSYLINLASPDAALRAQVDRVVRGRAAAMRGAGAARTSCRIPGNYMDDRDERHRAQRGRDRRGAGAGAGRDGALPRDHRRLRHVARRDVRGAGGDHRARARAASRRASACASTPATSYSAGYDLVNDYDDVWTRFDDMRSAWSGCA